MEDINFKKFICYILNCIGATEKITVFYVDNKLKKLAYDGDNSTVKYDDLKCFYTTTDAHANATDFNNGDILYNILNDNTITSNIKQYFNIKQVPSYITKGANQLDVSQSIHQAFNLIKMFFDAKKWYFNQYTNNQNQMSYSSINFKSDKKMFGGFEIKYKDGYKEVDNSTSYDNFLANVLKDFIYMVSGQTNQIKNFDVITLYVLSKINYYLAKKYAILSINNKPEDFYDTLNEYNQIVAYDNSFFNNFTYYKNVTDKDITNYPRYYQKEILELLKAGTPTDKDDDINSYVLTINNLISLKINDNDIAKKQTIQKCITYKRIFDIYNSILQSNSNFGEKYNTLNSFFTNVVDLINKIKTAVDSDSTQNMTTNAGKTIKDTAQNTINISVFKDVIDNTIINTVSTVNDTDTDVNEIKRKIKENINSIVINITDIYAFINEMLDIINKQCIAKLFKTIKTYIKKNSNNTLSSIYQSPTISYSLTPMNIRPLIAKRATETDLSNYAAQIASDSFLNSNKLPALPEVTTLGAPGLIGLMEGGSTNINNSSNVYRTIFNSILKTLNSKKIRLNDKDRKKVDDNLDNLERTEQYLKSTLSDYAKYASATEDRKKMISYDEIHKFVTEYENKLREYNQNSAHMLKFIGKLTRYLIIK